jgi:hypothetical protein
MINRYARDKIYYLESNMIKKLPLHPFLFGTYFILFLYGQNIGELSPKDMLGPLVINLLLTAILLLVFAIFIKDYFKRALVLSVFIVFFYSYGFYFDLLKFVIGLNLNSKNYLLSLVSYLILFSLFAFIILRSRRDYHKLHLVLNGVISIMIIVNMVQIGTYLFKETGSTQKTVEESKWELPKSSLPTVLPDIYYIILDGYTSSPVLAKYYGFDNREFEKYLSGKEFYIAKKSLTNYTFTYQSMAASLNMEYIDTLIPGVDKTSRNYRPLQDLINANRVSRILKSAGYKIIFYGSGYKPTKFNPMADKNVIGKTGLSEFAMAILERSVLKSYFSTFAKLRKRIAVSSLFDALFQGIAESGPKFVFAHIYSPHPPFVFDEKGGPIADSDSSTINWGNQAQYVSEMKWVNHNVERILERLLEKSSSRPVIIIQGDHGSLIEGRSEIDNLLSRASILNAFLFPESCVDNLYESISPVNSFRVLFNCIFKTHYSLLDENVYWTNMWEPYQYKKVTDRLH